MGEKAEETLIFIKKMEEREDWKAGTMIYPVPAVMISCGDIDKESNIFTASWVGTICTNPPMCYVSIRPERYSYNIIKNKMEFAINLSNRALAKATDYCGVVSGAKFDKFDKMGLSKEKAKFIAAPLIKESPISIECKVKDIIKLGSHDMFIADVVNIRVDKKYINQETGALDLYSADMLSYCHGEYFNLGEFIGYFGWSVSKKGKIERRK